MSVSWPPESIELNPDKRVLFLTKDLNLIKEQLYNGLNLQMSDLSVDDLLRFKLETVSVDSVTALRNPERASLKSRLSFPPLSPGVVFFLS